MFELLQNADDNSFTKAAALGASPYISFRVYPRRIIIECNEDGFTDENLKAICAVGKSSKSGSEGYIGEKGIGFKSVFMAAWKARVQSGVFSFSFTHRKGQSGMGMISPVWEDDFEELSPLLTRLTLHLHDTGDADTLQDAQRIIQEQFHELQETFLLFMKNLRMIKVSFHSTDGSETSSVRYFVDRPRPNYAVLTRTVVANGTTRDHDQHYHVTTHQATNVPRHENRTYSDLAPSTSQVVLAFPLSETSVPILQPQDVFVYLPVRPVGFKFIIQADFVTDASRQDVVRDSRRNFALLDGVAAAFAKATLQFCEQDGLRLQWMRYLPYRNDENWGPFWRYLIDKIAHHLRRTRVIYCHKKFDQHYIDDLVRLPRGTYDENNGEPLFEDEDKEVMVSQRYSVSDQDILEEYGLEYALFPQIIKWLAADLNRGAQSRMKSATTTVSWHTQAAKLFHLAFSRNWTIDQAELKKLTLLPLAGGTWVSATSGSVFFARVNGIDIPQDIGLRIIDGTITNTHRIKLFEALGVQTAPVALIRRKILEVYARPGHPLDIPLQTSKRHLEFLYVTHHLKDMNEPPYSNIALLDLTDDFHKPSETVMYMSTASSHYSPWELLRGDHSYVSPGNRPPWFMAHTFVSPGYFQNSPQTPADQEMTWVDWFYCQLNTQKYVYFGDTYLSDAAKYLQIHRPEKFLGALRIHLRHNRHLSPEFIACVRETKVLCRGGPNCMTELKDTYFPTKRLESLVERYVESDAFFPWLWLDTGNNHETIPQDWDRVVRVFIGGIEVDELGFALDMLKYSVRSLQRYCTPGSESRLFDLYGHIQSQYLAAVRVDEAKTQIWYAQGCPHFFVSIHTILTQTHTQEYVHRCRSHLYTS